MKVKLIERKLRKQYEQMSVARRSGSEAFFQSVKRRIARLEMDLAKAKDREERAAQRRKQQASARAKREGAIGRYQNKQLDAQFKAIMRED